MNMTTDLMPLLSDNSLPLGELPAPEDDEDAAGYQAMMKELPTIVSMSGLLDGDFDELHEIQNLLSPVSDDDDIDEGYEAAREAVDAAAAASASEDAYIQAMVPNPIPTEDISDGYDVSAMAAALDENLGFPSTSLITPATEYTTTQTSLSVRAPRSKRVHSPLESGLVTPVPSEAAQPRRKKSKLVTPSPSTRTKTPATIRTSLDGISAPNPLLFGRPIKLPSEANLLPEAPATGSPKPKSTKLSLKPRSSPKSPKTPSSQTHIPCSLPLLRKVDPPKLRKPAKPMAPEEIKSYPVPSFVIEKIKSTTESPRPPLCKLIFKGKVEPTLVGSTDEAVARISAPNQKTKPKGCSTGTSSTTTKAKSNQPASATASKKKASNGNKTKKKSGGTSSFNNTAPKKKAHAIKATKKTSTIVVKNPLSAALSPAIKVTIPPSTQVPAPAPVPAKSQTASKPDAPTSSPKIEKFLVANPLDNIPPPEPAKKVVVPPPPVAVPPPATVSSVDTKILAPPSTTTSTVAVPAVVSSNSSAASDGDIPDEMPSSADAATTGQKGSAATSTKTSSFKPMTKEEKAQACRDRNRQHARNTRLRKKAYVEELKRSLMDLVEQRDSELQKKKSEASAKEQLRQTRRQVLQDFLTLRGRNERDEAKWEKLVKDSKTFQLRMPVTKFQTMAVPSPGADEDQVLVGIQDVIADAGYLASVLQTLGTAEGAEKTPVYLQYSTDQAPILMDGTMGILSWKATSCGAISQGAPTELTSCGTIRGVFCPDSNKLVSAVLLFDTGAIQAQLQKPLHV